MLGVFVLFLVVPGVEVGHGDTFDPENPAITFLRVWWFYWLGMSHRTAVWIAYTIMGVGAASLALGVGGLAFHRWKR